MCRCRCIADPQDGTCLCVVRCVLFFAFVGVGRGGEVEQRDGSNVVELAFVLGSAWNLNPNEYVPILFGYSVPCTYTCTNIIYP